MFEKIRKLFNDNSIKNCHFIYLKKNGNEFETNSISFGKSHWSNEDDLNGDHIFRLMSMSKPITALAAMQLVEKGKLNLSLVLEAGLKETIGNPDAQKEVLNSIEAKVELLRFVPKNEMNQTMIINHMCAC